MESKSPGGSTSGRFDRVQHADSVSLQTGDTQEYDAIRPSYYQQHESGIECIEVVRHMNFNRGNAVKYIWRADDKGDPIENLEKAIWYLQDEVKRIKERKT